MDKKNDRKTEAALIRALENAKAYSQQLPVSYTHLDVYKRQIYDSPKLQGNQPSKLRCQLCLFERA